MAERLAPDVLLVEVAVLNVGAEIAGAVDLGFAVEAEEAALHDALAFVADYEDAAAAVARPVANDAAQQRPQCWWFAVQRHGPSDSAVPLALLLGSDTQVAS